MRKKTTATRKKRKRDKSKDRRPMHETAGNADTGTVKTKGKKENRPW